jgi:hypothetical protein
MFQGYDGGQSFNEIEIVDSGNDTLSGATASQQIADSG